MTLEVHRYSAKLCPSQPYAARQLPAPNEAKLGPKAATMATAHKIAVIFYTMVKNQLEYDEALWAAETPRGKGWKQNSNGKPNDWATNLSNRTQGCISRSSWKRSGIPATFNGICDLRKFLVQWIEICPTPDLYFEIFYSSVRSRADIGTLATSDMNAYSLLRCSRQFYPQLLCTRERSGGATRM